MAMTFDDIEGSKSAGAMTFDDLVPVTTTSKPAWYERVANGLAQQGRALRNTVNGIVEPAATLATGALAVPVSAAAGVLGNLYSDATGSPPIGNDVQRDVLGALTYSPRTDAGQAVLGALGHAVEVAKLPPFIPSLGSGPVVRGALNSAEQLATRAASSADDVGRSFQTGAQRLMVHAIKPTPKQVISGDAAIAARELLARGINPNTAGLSEIQRLIDELGARTRNVIGNSRETVSQREVLDAVTRVRDKFSNQVDPRADMNAIGGVAERFANHPDIPTDAIPVQKAQAMKQGTYQVLKGKYGEVGSAETEAQKALAGGLRQGIERAVPDVVPLNAEQSALITAMDVVERRTALDIARDPAQLTGMFYSPAAWAAFTANKSSAFKAFAAQAINSLGKSLRLQSSANRFAAPVRQAPVFPDVPPGQGIVPFNPANAVNAEGAPQPYRPDWVPGTARGEPVDITPQDPLRLPDMTANEFDMFKARDAQQRAAQYRAAANRDAAAQAAAEAEAQASRQPTSGGQVYDLDPITGRLRAADQGLKGATPDVMQNYGTTLDSAIAKLSGRMVETPASVEMRPYSSLDPSQPYFDAGARHVSYIRDVLEPAKTSRKAQAFALTAEERIAWNKAKVDLEHALPEMRGLSDKQITERMMDRQWVADTVAKSREKAAGFNAIANRSDDRVRSLQAAAERDRLMDFAASLEERIRNARPDMSRKQQGPKTRAAKLSDLAP